MGLSKFVFYRLLGWRIEGRFDKKIKKSVIIVVPHTSSLDFFLGIFTRSIQKLDIHYIAKKELFKWPFGWYFRWTGGVSLDRTPGQNKVEAIAELFEKRDVFRLSLAPEGTRAKVLEWKTGYYFIAKAAKVPIIPVAFDYKLKKVIIHPPFIPTDDMKADTQYLVNLFKGTTGRHHSV
ncbi:MAG: acyltransferase [Flavobacteriaceae bacterium]|nr:acyltransferase [Flavobacteriaceae bacterium]